MKLNKIKKKLEIALTKRSIENKPYYIIESHIITPKEKSNCYRTNKKLTKVGVCFNSISPTITKNYLKFLLIIKIFNNFKNLNTHFNSISNIKNIFPSIIKIKNILFKSKSVIPAYIFLCGHNFYTLKSLVNKNLKYGN